MAWVVQALYTAELILTGKRVDMRIKIKEHKLLLGAVLLLSLTVLGFLIWAIGQEAANSSRLTPPLVLATFQEAGFKCADIGPMDYCGGPLACGDQNVQFILHQGEREIMVRVIRYGSSEEAAHHAGVVNSMNWRMHGSFVCAFCRGSTVLALDPCPNDVAREVEAIGHNLRLIPAGQLASNRLWLRHG